MVPAGACCIVEARGRIVVEAATSGAGRTISLILTTVPGAGATAMVLLNAESLHLAREFLDALQERGLSAGLLTLASSGGEIESMTEFAQRAAASNSIPGWPARAVCTGRGSWLHQMLRRKYSGRSEARLLKCLRNCDGLRSPSPRS
jgi:hypothetical protein